MSKTLSTSDPNLLLALQRHRRVQVLWGLLLIVLGLLTQFTAGADHPVSGLPFLAVGLACLVFGDPALLAAVATLLALSLVATLNGVTTILGPDPLVTLISRGTLERIAMVVGKFFVVLTAANQFFLYRLLYGTSRAQADEPDLAVIPAMLPNRTDRLARWARWLGLSAAACGLLSGLTLMADPGALAPRVLAELGGSLGAVALGVGLGAAFSPTDERPAALLGAGLGLIAYLACVLLQLRLL